MLLPGFIDSHVHLQLSDAHRCLRGGTTTVRDLGWVPQVIFARRQTLRSSGPDILAAGGILRQPGGYPSQAGWCPAAWMGLKDRGRIEVNLRADLILVDGNPLQDLSCLASPSVVFYLGEPVEK